jgi:hypothetical protein
LHRLFQRHDISRLPSVEGERTRKKFKSYPIGYFHVDMAQMRTAQCTLYMFVAIDRASKFAFVELHEKATRRNATEFLRRLLKAVPYKVHTVLTDNVLRQEGDLGAATDLCPPKVISDFRSTSSKRLPPSRNELSAIANTGSSTRYIGPHRPQHEMQFQAEDPSIVYRVADAPSRHLLREVLPLGIGPSKKGR